MSDGGETVRTRVGDGFRVVALARPDRLNSFNERMHADLSAALDAAEADKATRALILTGEGRGFCAGQDLSDRATAPGAEPPDLSATIARFWNPLVERVRALPFPVIAAVNGVAAGAGANLAFACDLVVAARSAKFIQAFAKLGLMPDSGGTWSVPHLVGRQRALGLMLLADPLDAETAERWGLIWKAVDDAALMPEAEALARKLGAYPTHALVAIRHAVDHGLTASMREQLAHERDGQGRLGRDADYAEGVRAFMEKRAPAFRERS